MPAELAAKREERHADGDADLDRREEDPAALIRPLDGARGTALDQPSQKSPERSGARAPAGGSLAGRSVASRSVVA